MIKAPSFERLIPHVFYPGDPCIGPDAMFGVMESLLAKFRSVADPAALAEAGAEAAFLDMEFDSVLSRPGRHEGATDSTGSLE